MNSTLPAGAKLRTVRAPFGSLPVPLTTFVGRQRDQAEVEDLLGRARLVTLVGPGGAGKTRLAERVARTLADTGTTVRWVELAPVAEADGVVQAIQNAVRAPDGTEPTAADAVVAALGPGPSLLVLDNCEHQLDAIAGVLRDILAAGPSITALATSREPLGIGGEATWDVDTLPVPAGRPGLSAADVLATPAGQLFVDRAKAANAGFRLDDDAADDVARLVRRLDGLPLALELAAVRCRAMGPAALADALDDRFALLVGGDRTAVARQRTLQASVDWSHDLLPEPERVLLRRLGIFAGPFTARAAEAVTATGSLTMGQVLPGLIRLVDKSLVVRVPGPSIDRYRLLETIRAFALDQLDDAGERAEITERHVQFFTARAAAIAVGMDDRQRDAFLPVVDIELADLDQARRDALEAGEVEVAASIATDLTRYWCARGHYRAATEAQAALLPAVPTLEPRPAARLLWGAAHVALSQGDVLTAGGRAIDAVELARRADDLTTLGRALAAHAGALSAIDPSAAAVVFAEAATVARAAGDRWSLGVALVNQAMAIVHVGRGDRAVEQLAEGQEIGLALGDTTLLAWHAVAVGWLANRDGDMAVAEAHLREAIALAEEAGDLTPVDLATGFLAEALAWQGHGDDAIAMLEPVLARLGQQGAVSMAGPLGLEMGNVLLLAGEAQAGLGFFSSSLAHPVVALIAYLRAQGDLGQGACLLALGRAEEALESLERCVGFTGDSSPWVESMGKVLLGEARARCGHERPYDVAVEGLQLAVDVGFALVQIEAVEMFAAVSAGLGEEEAAFGARLLGAARAERAIRGVIPAVVGLSRGAEAEAAAVAALGAERCAEAMALGAATGLRPAARDAIDAFGPGPGAGAGARARPVSGWGSLTPAELRVAELAARGLSNPRISEDLFISRETVKSHLSRIYVKLDVSGRAELAAAWAIRG